jgi:hypothetical protein
VFEFWYRARNSLSPFQAYIDEKLNNAGRSGWGSDLPDLESVFEHLERNSGYWSRRYSSLATYWGGRSTSLFYPNPLDVPVAFVNFANVIEENLSPLRVFCNEFYHQTARLDSALARDNWSEVGRILKIVHTHSSRAKLYLWVFPKPYEYASRIAPYAKALSAIERGASAYVANDSVSMALLRTAVSCLAVFMEQCWI